MQEVTQEKYKACRYLRKNKEWFCQDLVFYAHSEVDARRIAGILVEKQRGEALFTPPPGKAALSMTWPKRIKASHIRLAEKKIKIDGQIRSIALTGCKDEKQSLQLMELASHSTWLWKRLNRLGLPVPFRYAKNDEPFKFRQALPPELIN